MLFKLFVCVLPSQIHVARVSIFDTRMSSLPLTRVENVFLNFAGMSFTMYVKLSILNYAFTVVLPSVLFLFSDTFSGATRGVTHLSVVSRFSSKLNSGRS